MGVLISQLHFGKVVVPTPTQSNGTTSNGTTSDSTNTPTVNTSSMFFNSIDSKFHCEWLKFNQTHSCWDSTVFESFIRVDSLTDQDTSKALSDFVMSSTMSGLVPVLGAYMENEHAEVSSQLRSSYFMVEPIIYEGVWSETGAGIRPQGLHVMALAT